MNLTIIFIGLVALSMVGLILKILIEIYKFKQRRKIGYPILYCILNIGK